MLTLTLFYDGDCPLCVREIEHLQRFNQNQKLTFKNIHAPNFSTDFPHIDKHYASEILHAEYANGKRLLGLDATYAAWKSVGKGYWIAPLRWPLIRLVADCAYRYFARNRYRISFWLTGVAHCEQCSISPTDSDKHRRPGTKHEVPASHKT